MKEEDQLAAPAIEYIEEKYALGLNDVLLNQIISKYEIRIQRIRKIDSEST